MKHIILSALLLPTAALAEDFAHDVPHMVEQAAAAGINHHYTGDWEYFVGGGAASFDCNADRLPDLFLAGGEGPSGLYVNGSATGGELQFKQKPLFDDEADLKRVTGAYPININNDAYVDLAVMRLGKNYLLRGGPNCSFTKANKDFAFDGGRDWTTAFSAIWEEDAVYPTLAFGNYVDRDAPGSPWGTCSDNQLMRTSNDTLTYADVLPLTPSYCTLSMSFTDWEGRGDFDLRVTNDRQYHRGGYEQMWDVTAGEDPRQYGTADGWQKLIIWGMGIAEADLNSDGKPEYALSSMGDTMLQTLDEDADENQPQYRDIAFERGSTAHRPYTGGDIKPSTGWHTQFADFNNDARSDLFIAKGNVERMPDFAEFDPDNMLLGNWDGNFSHQGDAAGIALNTRGRGAVVTDFNADGMVDLLVVNRGSPASLFRNQGLKTDWGFAPMGNFLSVELNNGDINPDAIGAKISVKTGNLVQTKTVQIGGGHASGQNGFHHFGLGVAERAQIRIKWPGRNWSAPFRVFANNFVVIDQGSDAAKYWYPK
jgi:hypothetical protein